VIDPTNAAIAVTRELHGPFERIVLTSPIRVPGEDFMGTAEVSVYRIGDVLIDAGASRFSEVLIAALAAQPPRRILLTHQHEDHAGGVAALCRAFDDVTVFAPRPLLPLLANPEPIGDYRIAYWGASEPIPCATAIDESMTCEVAGLSLEAVSTPGHTPGHMAFLVHGADRLYALSGDLLVNTRSYFGFFESCIDDLLQSQRRIAEIGEQLYLLPAHGRARSDGAATLHKAADWLDQEAANIREASARLQSSDPFEVSRDLYGEPEPAELATGGDFSTAALVRSVLTPYRAHPIPRLTIPIVSSVQTP
jgi:glyoxylase-like metal-dependent hydrolase (beta-lactamase superfamily II)